MLFLMLPAALAGELTLLPSAPIVPDGQPVTLLISAPGVTSTDKVKVKPYAGELTSASVVADGVIEVVWTPPAAKRDDSATLKFSVRGGTKLDEEVKVPLKADPRGDLKLAAVPEAWTVGTRQQTRIVVSPDGYHNVPMDARDVSVACTDGKVGPPERGTDGTWSAVWTPPSPAPKVPTNVLCTATDNTAPGEIQGWGVVPIRVKATQSVKAPAGSQNVLIIGEDQYGPVTAKDDGTVDVDAVLDPRVQSANLQSVDTTGYRTDSTVQLDMGSPNRIAFAPLPAKVPAGTSLTVAVAVIKADGTPWDGAAPTLDGATGESKGSGWYTFDTTTPDAGAWALTAAVDDMEAKTSTTVIEAVPTVSAVTDPATLNADETAFSVTAHLKDASGAGLTKKKPVFVATNATAVGAFKDNGDGTYTQKYKLGKANAAVVQVHAPWSATGLPVASIAAWPRGEGSVAPGQTADIAVVALDALGVPVPNVEISLSTPVGDGAVPPTIKTDKYGTATLSLRAGSETGPVAVLASANGIEGAATLYVGDHTLSAGTSWDGYWPQVGIGQGAAVASAGTGDGGTTVAPAPANAGPPAAVTLSSIPAFTTPGAAILVTMRVVDAQGLAVSGAKPTASASLGTVSDITDNGDGSYTFTLQLPPGQDGPVQITAMGGSAQGSLVLPTFENAGSVANNNNGSSGGSTKTPREPRERADLGGKNFRFRLLAMDMAYTHTATSSGEASVPSEVAYKKGLPVGVLGASMQFEGWVPGTPAGFDARVKAGRYNLEVGNKGYKDAVTPAMAGLRFRGELAPGMLGYAGAWGHVMDVPIFRYAENNTAPLLLSRRVIGGRVGAGFMMETDMVLVRMELAETFAPYPVNTHAGLGIDIYVAPEIGSFVHIGAEVDQQHMTFRVGDGVLSDDLKLRSRQATILVGFGGAF
jgi:hypothetical protein